MSAYGLTSNVLLRVRRIAIGNVTGTAFTMEVDDRQYLVTAKHVVATMGGSGKVALNDKDEKPEEFEVHVLSCDDPIDIAVLVPKKAITKAFALPASLEGAAIGQDMYFVGYPLGDYSLTTKTANERIGFVRRALFSAQEAVKGGKNLPRWA